LKTARADHLKFLSQSISQRTSGKNIFLSLEHPRVLVFSLLLPPEPFALLRVAKFGVSNQTAKSFLLFFSRLPGACRPAALLPEADAKVRKPFQPAIKKRGFFIFLFPEPPGHPPERAAKVSTLFLSASRKQRFFTSLPLSARGLRHQPPARPLPERAAKVRRLSLPASKQGEIFFILSRLSSASVSVTPSLPNRDAKVANPCQIASGSPRKKRLFCPAFA
jgi:hypothetical protein